MAADTVFYDAGWKSIDMREVLNKNLFDDGIGQLSKVEEELRATFEAAVDVHGVRAGEKILVELRIRCTTMFNYKVGFILILNFDKHGTKFTGSRHRAGVN